MQLVKRDGLRRGRGRDRRGARLLGSRAGEGHCHERNGKDGAGHCVCAHPSVEAGSLFRRERLVPRKNVALDHGSLRADQRSIRSAPYEWDAAMRTQTKATVAITQANSNIVIAPSGPARARCVELPGKSHRLSAWTEQLARASDTRARPQAASGQE